MPFHPAVAQARCPSGSIVRYDRRMALLKHPTCQTLYYVLTLLIHRLDATS